ncbi:MAG: cytochrome c oxidase subunit I [Actinomycetia bacterium]|nr:cytochrome c oxidase subunit I [Actinomycetes bacterium]
MAIVEKDPAGPLALPGGESAAGVEPSLGAFRRPVSSTGWRGWLTTVDHKKIGIMYGFAAFIFFLVGGIEALLIRAQLALPNASLLNADAYNQIYTMHALTMVFLVIMPMAAAFANYLMPIQIGARDVAFPRLNAFSFWIWLAGGSLLASSFFLGGAPDGGWFNYAPNASVVFSPSHGIDFYAVGLAIAGIGSMVSSINLAVTVLNMRSPGMTMMRMPVFTWMVLVIQFLLIFALPVITVALLLLLFDRRFDANFFSSEGSDPLLWQHLFWIFGHPEVYILILPSFGIVSEIIPVFSRKPIFGYPFIVFSGIAIGFMGWGVWAHHMFTSGIGPISVAAFAVSTMFIAVPTGVKILNWMATMWGGKIRFELPMMFAIALVAMFTIGGLSGVSHAIAPSDTQQTDTYYIVAHFHYVLFGGALMGLFGGMFFWWPKVFGYHLNKKWGLWNFWLMLIGMNLTFGPMHVLGLQGMSRRIQTYKADLGFELWNLVASIGSLIIALGVLAFIIGAMKARSDFRAGRIPLAGPDPWDARSLEWMIPSPVPEHNFDEVPVVTQLDEFWHRKYGLDEDHRVVRIAATEDIVQKGDATDVHLPSPSYWPPVFALGMWIVGYGLIFNLALAGLGGLIVVGSMFGWGLEPSTEPETDHGHDDHESDDAESATAGASDEGDA